MPLVQSRLPNKQAPRWHQINDSTEQSRLHKGDLNPYRLVLTLKQEKPKLFLEYAPYETSLGSYILPCQAEAATVAGEAR